MRKGARYHLKERRYGSFSRSVTLPTNIHSEDIDGSYEAGILTLKLPKSEDVKPKRIPIKGAKPKLLEGKFLEKKNRE